MRLNIDLIARIASPFISIFLVISALGCEDDEAPTSLSSTVNAGETAGANAGETAGANAGETAGANAGETAGANAGETAGANSGGVMTDEVTYYQHIKPLIETNCIHCHTPGGAGLFSLETYEDAQMWAPALVEATASRSMPPWGAFDTEGCEPSRPWRGDLSLSDEEIARFAAWLEQGTPEGEAERAETGTRFEPATLSRIDFEGRASAKVEIPAGGDSFICVVIDPGLTEETWIKGIEFAPDNEALVHHVVLFTDPTRASLALANEEGTYPCFGSANVPGTIAAAWAPGIQPSILPEDHAMRVAPETLFVMQMHYSPQGGADELLDQTSLRFEYADEAPRYEVYLQLMGNFGFSVYPAFGLQPSEEEAERDLEPEFAIPSDASEHRELLRWTYTGELPSPGGGGITGLNELKLLSVSPHMHYAGVDMRVHLDRPTYGEPACEPGSLTSFFGCATRESCLNDDDALSCLKTSCAAEWNDLSLVCWGCAHTVFRAGVSPAESLAMINECERPSPDRMSLPEQPARECLVSAPQYSFSWQRAYEYEAPIAELPTLMPGDILSIDCRYNNTMENPLMRDALRRAGLDAPIDVELGDETLDEMCLVGLLFAFERVSE